MAEASRIVRPFGDRSAPPGTEIWAQRWRDELYNAVSQIDLNPSLIESQISLGKKHRAWTLLKDGRGQAFRSFEEFCKAEQPHGLGTDPAKVKKAIELVHGARAMQLETVPKAQPGPGRGHTVELQKEKNYPGDVSFTAATASRVRAISRAPDAVKDAYTEGRISQKLAAKLGPKSPTPELAATIAEIAGEIRKVKDRKEVDRIVREKLGQKKLSAVDRIVGMVEKLSAEECAELGVKLRPLLGGLS